MVWDVYDYINEQYFYSAMQFRKCEGHLDIPVTYVDENGLRLGEWINKLRRLRKKNDSTISSYLVTRLDQLGMTFGKTTYETKWDEQYSHALEYYNAHFTLEMPSDYIAENGTNPYKWLLRQRKSRKNGLLSREQIERLDRLHLLIPS